MLYRPYGTDPDSERVRKLVEGYAKYRFIENEAEDVNFGNVVLYTREKIPGF